MIIGVIGAALIVWGVTMAFKEFDRSRPEIFQGPIGRLVNWAVIALGGVLIYWGWIS